MDDRELNALALAVQSGHEDSFRLLVDGLSRTLIAMAYRYSEDWEWARDLTQDTWIRVHQNIRRYDPARSFTAWIYSIHRNVCRDHLRRPWVRREESPGEGLLEDLPDPGVQGPQEDLERKEFRQRILAAAAGLSESQREVFLRVDVEQGDQKEVAQDMGLRFGTLRTTLHFARKKVAGALRDWEGSMEAGS